MATLLRVDPLGGCFTAPSSTKILSGTLSGGSFTALSAIDTNYYLVNSTTTGTRISDWYAQFSGIPAGSANFKVTYVGNTLTPSARNFNARPTGATVPPCQPGGHSASREGSSGSCSSGGRRPSAPMAATGGGTDRAFGTAAQAADRHQCCVHELHRRNVTSLTITIWRTLALRWRRVTPDTSTHHTHECHEPDQRNLTSVSALNFNGPLLRATRPLMVMLRTAQRSVSPSRVEHRQRCNLSDPLGRLRRAGSAMPSAR
jgi:hypothetical protein